MSLTKMQLLAEILQYTDDVGRNHLNREMRARAKMVLAYANLLDAIEPDWRQVVAETIPADLKLKDVPFLFAETPNMEVNTQDGSKFFTLAVQRPSSTLEPTTKIKKASQQDEHKSKRIRKKH